MENRIPISFHFQPSGFDKKTHAVEKSLVPNEAPRRYLVGIASGPKIDGHGERVTPECIQDFLTQANSGDILLYAGKHDVDFVDDVGILVHASITPEGEWYTEYRLFDEQDDVGQATVERANKLWKQVNGIDPYKRPKQKGFSIEGYIPDNGLVQVGPDDKRVMSKIVLDGVVVVPRPSYQDSIAHAVYKALGELTPEATDHLKQKMEVHFKDLVQNDEIEQIYLNSRYKLQEALEQFTYDIMSNPTIQNKHERLAIAFDEYKELMLKAIMAAAPLFKDDNSFFAPAVAVEQIQIAPISGTEGQVDIQSVFKSLVSETNRLAKSLKGV